MLLAPHSSTEPPTTMTNASCRSAEAQVCASLTPGFRASKSPIGPDINDGFTKKAIDHIIISRPWRRCVTQCRVCRGAQLGNTDHRLLCANIYTPETEGTSRRAHASTTNQTSRAWRTTQPSCSTSVKSPTAMMPSLNQQTSGRTSKTPSQHAQQNV